VSLDPVVVTPNAPAAVPLSECTENHTRLLRLALAVAESRSYWENVDPLIPVEQRPQIAFEQRWFGAKSLERVRYLIATFAERYDAYPEALAVLRRWRSMEPATRQVICHWHIQLSDPIYRLFAGRFLVDRRALHEPKVDRNAVLRWLKEEFPGRWAESTCVQFATKLLSAASEAGLLSSKGASRAVVTPRVTDLALSYLFYLLRDVRIVGSLTDNPYLASVDLQGGSLDQRLRALPGLTFRRMAQLTEFDWHHDTLTRWAEAHA
jgi:hypothetical protein